MNGTVWKYPIDPDMGQPMIPEGAQFLTVQMQGGIPTTWWLVDPMRPRVQMDLTIVGTGWGHISELATLKHLGTFQTEEGLVFHVFSKSQYASAAL